MQKKENIELVYCGGITEVIISGISKIDDSKYTKRIYLIGNHINGLKDISDIGKLQDYCRQIQRENYTPKGVDDDIDYNGPRCIKCLKLLNDYVCKDCLQQHGLEYKKTSICVECYGEHR